MLNINKEEAKEILVNEQGLTPFQADWLLKSFPAIHNELAEAVERWFKDRTVLNVDISGVNIRDVMKPGRGFLQAIEALNRLLDDDVSPEKRHELGQLLTRPIIKW